MGGFEKAGTDLDTIFEPRGAQSARANVNFENSGVDIATLYYPLTNGGSAPANTGLEFEGVDLSTLFAEAGTVSYPDPNSQFLDTGSHLLGAGSSSYSIPTQTQQGGEGPFDSMTVEVEFQRLGLDVTVDGSDLEYIGSTQPFANDDKVIVKGTTDVITDITNISRSSSASATTSTMGFGPYNTIRSVASGDSIDGEKMVRLSDTKVAYHYTHRLSSGGNYTGFVVIGTVVDENTISWGSHTSYGSWYAIQSTDILMLDSSHFVICYTKGSLTLHTRVASVSGSTITYGNETNNLGGNAFYGAKLGKLTSTHYITVNGVWQSGSTYRIYTLVCSWSGTTSTPVQGQQVITNTISPPNVVGVAVHQYDKVGVFWNMSGGLHSMHLSYGSNGIYNSNTSAFNVSTSNNHAGIGCVMIDWDHVLLSYMNSSNEPVIMMGIALTGYGTTTYDHQGVTISGGSPLFDLGLSSSSTRAWGRQYDNGVHGWRQIVYYRDANYNNWKATSASAMQSDLQDPVQAGSVSDQAGCLVVPRGAAVSAYRDTDDQVIRSTVGTNTEYISTISVNDSLPASPTSLELIPFTLDADIHSGTPSYQDISETYSIVNSGTAKITGDIPSDSGTKFDLRINSNNTDLQSRNVTKIQVDFTATPL